MAGSDASEGQAVWQPGGAEEDSRLREGNRHLHVAYDDEEEDTQACCWDIKQPTNNCSFVLFCLLVGCLTSQQHASVSQGRICTDKFTCCHTEIEAADQTFHLTQSQYTDTGPTSPSADPITPGAWQGSHWSANF